MQLKTKLSLDRIWYNDGIPVIFRRGGKNKLLVRTTIHNNHDDAFVRNDYLLGHRRGPRPKWSDAWLGYEVPNTWLNELVVYLLDKEGRVYLIQPYRENRKCAPACVQAQGFNCECSCMGEFHGVGNLDKNWKAVSQFFSIDWGDEYFASRLLQR